MSHKYIKREHDRLLKRPMQSTEEQPFKRIKNKHYQEKIQVI